MTIRCRLEVLLYAEPGTREHSVMNPARTEEEIRGVDSKRSLWRYVNQEVIRICHVFEMTENSERK